MTTTPAADIGDGPGSRAAAATLAGYGVLLESGGAHALLTELGYRVRSALIHDVLAAFGEDLGGSIEGGVPDALGLALTAAPNPFNPRVTLSLALPRAGHVRVTIHDLRGASAREWCLLRPGGGGR